MLDIDHADDQINDIISALLSENMGLIGITDLETKVAYCFDNEESRKDAVSVIGSFRDDLSLSQYEKKKENWNKIWEDNFTPVIIDKFCAIIAPHHDSVVGVKHCLVINPEMSFGTGHHETTEMMIRHMEEMNLAEQKVLDFGCGTGVLGILALKEGADSVDAIDYDQLCYDSSIDNAKRNGAESMNVIMGDISKVRGQYNFILANVNRAVLLDAAKALSEALLPQGQIVISGILKADKEIIIEEFSKYLTYVSLKSKGEWLSILFSK